MAVESDIRRLIAAGRDLARRCDQGPEAWLRHLTQPLPPLLRDNSEQALRGITRLVRFDPLDQLGDYFPENTQQKGPGTHPHPGNQTTQFRPVPTNPKTHRPAQQPARRLSSMNSSAAVGTSDDAVSAYQPRSVRPLPLPKNRQLTQAPEIPERENASWDVTRPAREGKPSSAHWASKPSANERTNNHRANTADRIEPFARATAPTQPGSADRARQSASRPGNGQTHSVSVKSPPSLGQSLAARRKAHARESYRARHLPVPKDGVHPDGPIDNIPSSSQNLAPQPATETAVRQTRGTAIPAQPESTDTDVTRSMKTPAVKPPHAITESSAPQTQRNHDVARHDHLIAPRRPAEQAPAASPGEDDLSWLLADAAYRQGIDRT